MKILNPSSATLPNAEVLHFLSLHPPRAPDPVVGSYVPTSTQSLNTIRRDLSAYFTQITPWTAQYAAALAAEGYLVEPKTKAKKEELKSRYEEGFMKELLHRLGRYELTKGEVLMIMNLGLGLSGPDRMPPRLRREAQSRATENNQDGEDGDVDKTVEEQEGSDEMVLGVVCEELEDRFNEEDVRGILSTVGECVREFAKLGPGEGLTQVDAKGKGKGKANAAQGQGQPASRRPSRLKEVGNGRPVVDEVRDMVGEWRTKHAGGYDGAEEEDEEGLIAGDGMDVDAPDDD